MRHVILLLLVAVLCSASESAPAPVYDEVTIENEQIRVAISTLRASIRRVELLDTKPIVLPRHARNGPNALPDAPLPVLRAISTEALRKKPGRTEFQRGIVSQAPDGRWSVRITGAQGSGILRSMSEANGMVVLHHDQGHVAVGDLVDVLPFFGLL